MITVMEQARVIMDNVHFAMEQDGLTATVVEAQGNATTVRVKVGIHALIAMELEGNNVQYAVGIAWWHAHTVTVEDGIPALSVMEGEAKHLLERS